jgi:DNA mismatch repair protein MutS
VAQLAGMPAAVLRDARVRLQALQQAQTERLAQLDLFGAPAQEPVPEEQAAAADPAARELLRELAGLDCDALSPREALEQLYRLCDRARAADA